MPELPEVETIARGLNKKIKRRRFVNFWTDCPRYFGSREKTAVFRQCVIGKKIKGIERRAKNILIYLNNGYLLLIHQKLTGHLMVGKWKAARGVKKMPAKWRGQKWIPAVSEKSFWDPENRFIRLLFFLDNGQMLALSDLRRFAKVICGPKEKIFNLPEIKNLGPEPLSAGFSLTKFQNLFRGKRGKIKQILMDPNFVSGIGNIYSDEILWVSKIHPLFRAGNLSKKDLNKIYRTMKFVLKKALRLHGASIDDYRDVSGRRGNYSEARYVYQREGEPCPRCGTKIKRIKLGGRSAHFCPRCQKARF